jgi:diphthamide biosynthesis protein 2
MCPLINPPDCHKDSGGLPRSVGDGEVSNELGVAACSRHTIGGLSWELPSGQKMEDYLLLWIGSDNSAFANVVLTFNGCEIGRSCCHVCIKFAVNCFLDIHMCVFA